MSDPSTSSAYAPAHEMDGVNQRMGELDLQLRQLLRACGLAHLAFYDRDRAKLVTETPLPSEGMPAESESHSLERAGRQLFYILEELAPDFAELRTGSLIRTVVLVPAGALLYHSVDPGIHLCCATPRNRVDELIVQMAAGIDDLRPAVRYGMFPRRSYLRRHAEASERPVVEDVTEDTAERTAYTAADPAGAPDATVDLLRAALGVHGLHYVAYYAGGASARTADIFGHPALRSHFGSSTPQQRRDKYGLLGQLLPGVTGRMNTSLHALLEGEIQQMVLRVGQGAVYFQQLYGRHYLLGVALDQSRLTEADRHIERLGRELASE